MGYSMNRTASCFTGLDGRRPDEGLILLDETFNLDEQLLALEEGRPS